jgi:hypothetical protein
LAIKVDVHFTEVKGWNWGATRAGTGLDGVVVVVAAAPTEVTSSHAIWQLISSHSPSLFDQQIICCGHVVVLVHMQAFHCVFPWEIKTIQLQKRILLEHFLTLYLLHLQGGLGNLPIPIVLTQIRYCVPLLGVGVQHSRNEVSSAIADKLRRLILRVEDFAVKGRSVLVLKGKVAAN